MADFIFTIQLTITAKNRDSALKKVARAIYNARAHFDSAMLFADFVGPNGTNTMRETELPEKFWQPVQMDKGGSLREGSPKSRRSINEIEEALDEVARAQERARKAVRGL